jgi:hypothetical protein
MSRRRQFQKCREASIFRAVEHQNVHARGVTRVLCPLENSGIDERFDRSRDLFHLVSNKGGEPFVCQQRARMPMQKYQQIEFTSPPHDRSVGEQPPDLFHPFAICQKLMNELSPKKCNPEVRLYIQAPGVRAGLHCSNCDSVRNFFPAPEPLGAEFYTDWGTLYVRRNTNFPQYISPDWSATATKPPKVRE